MSTSSRSPVSSEIDCRWAGKQIPGPAQECGRVKILEVNHSLEHDSGPHRTNRIFGNGERFGRENRVQDYDLLPMFWLGHNLARHRESISQLTGLRLELIFQLGSQEGYFSEASSSRSVLSSLCCQRIGGLKVYSDVTFKNLYLVLSWHPDREET